MLVKTGIVYKGRVETRPYPWIPGRPNRAIGGYMARMVSKSRFKLRVRDFLREVEQTRKKLIITDRGKPVLKVVPYTEEPEIWLKSLRGTVKSYKRSTEPLTEDWEALR